MKQKKIDTKKILAEYRTKKEEKRELIANTLRSKYINQWCEYCGVSNPADIDYSDHRVKIEYFLCDPHFLLNLDNEEVRQEFIETLGPETTNYYYNHKDDGGNSYADLEKGAISQSLKKKLQLSLKKH